MTSPASAVALDFEPIRLEDFPEVTAIALDNTEPRIAAYAVEPRNAMRRGRLKAMAAKLPWIGARFAAPERSFWIRAGGRRAGFVLLDSNGAWLHLHFVVIARELQGTGAADRVMGFVEDQARLADARGVDLYVDRRNYRAYHFYQRCGFKVAPERRYIFEVRRSGLPGPLAWASLPWHAAAEVMGTIGARGLPGRTLPLVNGGVDRGEAPPPMTLREGRIATITVEDPSAVESAVREAFRSTLARVVRLAIPFSANVEGGRLVAILQRMEKELP